MRGRHCRKAWVDKCDAESVRLSLRGQCRGQRDRVSARGDICHGDPSTIVSIEAPVHLVIKELSSIVTYCLTTSVRKIAKVVTGRRWASAAALSWVAVGLVSRKVSFVGNPARVGIGGPR